MAINMITRVLAIRGLRPAEKSVLICLAYHAHDDGTRSFPSIRTLALESGFSARTVKRALKSLRAARPVRLPTNSGTAPIIEVQRQGAVGVSSTMYRIPEWLVESSGTVIVSRNAAETGAGVSE